MSNYMAEVKRLLAANENGEERVIIVYETKTDKLNLDGTKIKPKNRGMQKYRTDTGEHVKKISDDVYAVLETEEILSVITDL